MGEGLNKSAPAVGTEKMDGNKQEQMKQITFSENEINFLVNMIENLKSGEIMKGTDKEHMLENLYFRLTNKY